MGTPKEDKNEQEKSTSVEDASQEWHRFRGDRQTAELPGRKIKQTSSLGAPERWGAQERRRRETEKLEKPVTTMTKNIWKFKTATARREIHMHRELETPGKFRN